HQGRSKKAAAAVSRAWTACRNIKCCERDLLARQGAEIVGTRLAGSVRRHEGALAARSDPRRRNRVARRKKILIWPAPFPRICSPRSRKSRPKLLPGQQNRTSATSPR